jgi:hypothetical protein
MSLKDGKKGDGDEREDSGREWRLTRGEAAEGGGSGARGGGSVKESEGGEGSTAVGRYFCACFVFNFSPPFARRGADAAPRRAAPRRTTPYRAATPGRGAVALVGVRLS